MSPAPGLTHLGSASTRDAMHKSNQQAAEAPLTDSMKMFRMGLEGGKPAPGEIGVQPEWFYKGNGHIVAAPGQPIPSPAFAKDAGEEPEMAGIYVIGKDGNAVPGRLRAGQRVLRPRDRAGELPVPRPFEAPLVLVRAGAAHGRAAANVSGMSRILRAGKVIWEKPFLSGEDNMSHTIANLEHHHFKYDLFRQPGDVHVHMFGTATLSFADGIKTETGDVFEIAEDQFGLPLRNCKVMAIAAIEALQGPTMALVNNAASDTRHDWRAVTPEYFDARVAVNLRHSFFAIQAVAPGMIAAGGGAIVNLGSIGWMKASGGYPAYAASKAAVHGMTRSFARDLGKHGIRVNTLVPGWVMTKRQLELWVDDAANAEIDANQCLAGRVLPDDIARMALFLSADDSRMCTAQNFVVDGGWV
jgi:NAD(P)-dependent dehydrogenase (short-subunit alcohol dehydrogenase family)